MIWQLAWRFALLGVLAFGGGAGLPLLERVAVRETGWVRAEELAAAVGLGQVTPGPVLVAATFIGYRVAGVPGGMAATAGVFLVPWVLGGLASRAAGRLGRSPALAGFRRGATAAAIGLMVVTALHLAREAGALSRPDPLLVAILALGLTLGTRLHPALVLLGGAALGAALAGLGW